jgi:hypothetical protein
MKTTLVSKLAHAGTNNSWSLQCDLQKLHPRLYLLKFDKKDRYDMCMTFCRYQEKYESPNSRFRNRDFEMIDFIEWYSKDRDGCFTYPNDWAGFNIPNTLFHNSWYINIKDKNKYDRLMLEVYYTIWDDIKYGPGTISSREFLASLKEDPTNPKYYLIGATDNYSISHETAHGFYYLLPKYKRAMNTLTNKLPKKFINKVYSWFKDIGYDSTVYKDEMQAYMSTGFPDSAGIEPGKLSKPFEEVLKNAKGL